MKKNLLFLFLFCFIAAMYSQAQVAINTDSSSADPSAILDLKSSSKGLLLPRIKDISTNPIANPKAGLLVYDSATKATWIYDGASWVKQGSFTLPYSASASSSSSAALNISNTATTGNAVGLYGSTTSSSDGTGAVSGVTAVMGEVLPTSGGGYSAAVRGINRSTTGLGIGVIGYQAGSGWGVYGEAPSGVGIYGSSISGYAGYFRTVSGKALYTIGSVQLTGIGEGAGKVLTSDANGIATWQNPSGGLTLPYTGSYSSSGDAFTINKTGSGNAIHLTINADDSRGIFVENNNTNTAATRAAINSVTLSGGPAIAGTNNGTTGNAASFTINNAASFGSAINATSNGVSHTVYADNTGTGDAAYFTIANPQSSSSAVRVEYSGSGAGVFSVSRGTGNSGDFRINNTSSTVPSLTASTDGSGSTAYFSNYGSGPAFTAQQYNSSNDIARFVAGNDRVARIDKNGKGYFDGGTQTGGADLAEAFAVEGPRNSYEPGDVLVVSTEADRTVTKSTEAYSTLVVGVYATKPGMLLTERTGAESQSDLVPMGVIGVIPTKVCNEGGVIHRGDLLVTSSQGGYAMKGADDKLKIGTVIGKALEDFTGSDTGLIKVLVSIK